MKRVAVIGGGISGLACAHRLLELGAEPRVFEASDRVGGLIRTRRESGFLWEEGPDSFLTEKPQALDLCRRLGLKDDVIGVNPAVRQSHVVKGGRLLPTPEGFYLLAPGDLGAFLKSPLLSWLGKTRAALDLVLPARKSGSDESLGAFVRRRFGREMLERLAQPMAAGVYSADPDALSLRATFPRFLDLEAAHGSVIRGLARRRRADPGFQNGVSGPRYGLFASLRGGMETLVDALRRRLDGKIALGAPVRSLRRSPGGWTLDTPQGPQDADALCLALPSPLAARLLAPLDPALAGLIDRVPYADTASVYLAYDAAAFPGPMDSLGFVAPAKEGLTLSGCTFSSVKFPGRAPEGRVLLRAFIPSSRARLKDEPLVRQVEEELRGLLGLRSGPLRTDVARHPAAMPQYPVGHLDTLREVERRADAHPGFALCGNGHGGLGLPDCVRSGETAAERLRP